jgi:hypothetical protein
VHQKAAYSTGTKGQASPHAEHFFQAKKKGSERSGLFGVFGRAVLDGKKIKVVQRWYKLKEKNSIKNHKVHRMVPRAGIEPARG